jgi:WD40 repeat protein
VRQLRPYPGANTNASVGSENGIWGLVFSPDGTKIAIIGRMGVLLQNVYTGWRWVAELNPENERIVSFAFNHNGFEMAIGMMAKKEAIRNQRRYRNGKVQSGPLVLPEAHTDSAGEQWYGVIRAWDLRAADYTDMVTGNNPPLELVYSPDNRMMAAVDEAGVLRLWDLMPEGSAINPPRLFAKLELGITGRKTVVIFSPDMQRLICATDNRVLIWNIARVRQEWSPSAPANQSESKS